MPRLVTCRKSFPSAYDRDWVYTGTAAILKAAKAGDIQAIRELRSIIRDDEYMKHKIKMDRERLKLAQKESDRNNWDDLNL